MATVWACNLLADAIRDVSGEAGRALLNTKRVHNRLAVERSAA